MVTKDLQTLNLKFDQVMFNSLVLTWERNFEVMFGIFSVLVFQISVLERYLDICFKISYDKKCENVIIWAFKVFVSLYYAPFLISLSSFPVAFVEGPHFLLCKWIHSKTIKETACSHMTSLEAQMFDWYFSLDKNSCSHNIVKQTL